jgi:hypothetical protein
LGTTTDSNIELNVFGGDAGFVTVYSTATINVHNGLVSTIRQSVSTANEVLVNMSGGIVSGNLQGRTGFEVNLTGGRTNNLRAEAGSAFNIFGTDFKLNGAPVAGLVQQGDSLPFNVPVDSLLTGVLADGTPFSISTFPFQPDLSPAVSPIDRIFDGSLTLTMSAPPPPPSPLIINAPGDPVPWGIRNGQVLNLGAGVGDFSEFGRFEAGEGSILNVVGGRRVGGVDAVGATVNVSDGQIEGQTRAYSGSRVFMSGGQINDIVIHAASVVDITGGEVSYDTYILDGGVLNVRSGARAGRLITAGPGSTFNFSGGSTRIMDLRPGSETNWSGGTIDSLVFAYGDATLNVFGTSFLLDGAPIAGLTAAGDSLVLTTRGGAVLTGFLADGSPFDLVLNAQSDFFQDLVDPAAILRLHLVPEQNVIGLLVVGVASLICVGGRSLSRKDRAALVCRRPTEHFGKSQ